METLTLEKVKSGTLTIGIRVIRFKDQQLAFSSSMRNLEPTTVEITQPTTPEITQSTTMEQGRDVNKELYLPHNFQRIDTVGEHFTVVVPKAFRISCTKHHPNSKCVTLDGPLANHEAKEIESLSIHHMTISQLGYEAARDMFTSTMMRLHENISNGTFNATVKEKDVLEYYELTENCQLAHLYEWSFVNLDKKLVHILAVTLVPKGSSQVMGAIVYSLTVDQSGIDFDRREMVRECCKRCVFN